MNILFVSEMATNKDTGMFWSVPNQVVSQSHHDNVLWFNIKPTTSEYWSQTGKYITHNLGVKATLDNMPEPFNNPDLVVFEGFYQDTRMMYRSVRSKNIPYIIVPRGSLTSEAQKKHRLKKILGNLYFFNKFTKNALAIHYLTEEEQRNSGKKWNKTSYVIPNGVVNISTKQWKSKSYSDNKPIRGVFIGRISIFHKGLDLLTDAVYKAQNILRQRNVVIDIYGPDREKQRESLKQRIKEKGIDDLLIVYDNPIFGEEKERILIESDFFVLTSRLEGHPMGLIEALSYGLPSLVTQGSNMVKEITNYNCGFCSDNKVDGIYQSLIKLSESSEQSLTHMSEQAIELAKQYQWSNIGEKTHKMFTELLQQTHKN